MMALNLSKKKSPWEIYGLTIGCVVCFVSLPAIFNKPNRDNINKNIVNEINKSCPRIIDSMRLDSGVALSGNKIQFDYSVTNVDTRDVDTTLSKENMKASVVNYVKTNQTCKIYRDNNSTLFFIYHDRNSNYLFTITVTPDLYK